MKRDPVYLKENVPRYTSFPPIPFWNKAITSIKWEKDLKASIEKQKEVDLYIHIPYCESLCYYCGCHRFISKNKSKGHELSKMICSEWKIYLEKISNIHLNSIHFGGGTPTFLEPKDLEKILKSLEPKTSEKTLKTIEIDPRVTNDEHLSLIKKYQFNKVSLGIQDFDREVQLTINRVQPFSLVEKIIKKIHKIPTIHEVNFDLIYGLPNQTTTSIEETIEKVKKLDPTSIALYSYAHMPSKIKNQRAIDPNLIPNTDEKERIHQRARMLLTEAGYYEIGFDHFAKTGSILEKYAREGRLKRNFMGYTHQDAPTLIGLGPSSISRSQHFFAQNKKSLREYQESLENLEIPIENGHSISPEDSVKEKIIMNFMCHGTLDLEKVSYPEAKRFFDLANKGWGEINHNFFSVSPKGRLKLRSIAATIDPYRD